MMAIRGELEDSRDALRTEKKARKSAQDEISLLKADLAVLLRAEDCDSTTPDRLRSLTMKATDEIQQKTRQEIEELCRTLE